MWDLRRFLSEGGAVYREIPIVETGIERAGNGRIIREISGDLCYSMALGLTSHHTVHFNQNQRLLVA